MTALTWPRITAAAASVRTVGGVYRYVADALEHDHQLLREESTMSKEDEALAERKPNRNPNSGNLDTEFRLGFRAATKPRMVEWGVEYVTAGEIPRTGYNQFPDRASCERFIENPPLWFDRAWMTNVGIVSREAATEWAPFTPEATQ
ncbi:MULTISPECIES: hypothetical protein [unclassified Cryobacterium]|uniref:hypothetical protein n=1 Tax=unclassified Cryobacterium TaxID=2649013 RepID=UPI001068D3F3|nr:MULTISPECIES: hypothetical protein [unclassified Cryobacterium]TFC59439.1 hypothetical protein E3O68_00635 [Cryobacterium sp. TMB3-1-2]TFC67235.1 hypothetical protein E3T21_17330 [Cryobacterium sp. TMB3-15]TFC73252.1 hypothetical protein E3T22_16725 [Cryobacterium sp. TMB3-10]TFD46140.1 hypothetical protein E3T58_01360 [Cryobacterium sp. TMB3-12]